VNMDLIKKTGYNKNFFVWLAYGKRWRTLLSTDLFQFY
jgi:hypothetical protein